MTELIQLPEQRVLYVRDRVPPADLPAFQGRALQAIWSVLDPARLTHPGHPYVRYHLVTEREMDVEVGVPVTTEAVGGGTVRVGSLPGGAALTHRHIGSHQHLGGAYAALGAGDANGLVPAGAPWEVYEWITFDAEPDPARWPSPDDWRTLLVQPMTPPPPTHDD